MTQDQLTRFIRWLMFAVAVFGALMAIGWLWLGVEPIHNPSDHSAHLTTYEYLGQSAKYELRHTARLFTAGGAIRAAVSFTSYFFLLRAMSKRGSGSAHCPCMAVSVQWFL